MCGRYRLSRRKQILEEHFASNWDDLEWHPRYNIAPTQFVPIIRQKGTMGRREFAEARWGLVPSWSRDSSKAASMINVRAETAETRPAYRDSLRLRRCLVPADGFYEWQRNGNVKQPYCFEVGDGELFAFAGIWDTWNEPSGGRLETCSILTSAATALTARIHDRMPAILDPEFYDVWLSSRITDTKFLLEQIRPFDPLRMRIYSVSTRVNSAVNDDEGCSLPAEPIDSQPNLFS